VTPTLLLATSTPAHRAPRGPWTVALALAFALVAAVAYFGMLGDLLDSLALAS
jgi:hypothetical protein